MEFSTFFEHAMQNVDLFFLLLGAVLVLAMHAGFAFLELGTVRHKNQVNALSKILTDFALSAIACERIFARSAIPPEMMAGMAAAKVSKKKQRIRL